jgi:oligopeptidase B
MTHPVRPPPVTAMRPHEVRSRHGTRDDEYYWLRDDARRDPQVLAYLAAENAYADAMLAHTSALQRKLYDEIVSRIRQDDESVAYRKRGYWYYRRYAAGKEYPVHVRRADRTAAPEEVLLDLEELARGHAYYEVPEYAVSPDGRLLAYAEDTIGRRQYTLRFKDLETGRNLPDEIGHAEAAIEWTADSRAVLYIEKDPGTLLGCRVRSHVLGTDPSRDALIYEEADDAYYLEIGTSKDGRYLTILSQSTVSSEQRVVRSDDPGLGFRALLPREPDHEYHAEHFDGRWIIRTNWQAPNFRIVEAPLEAAGNRDRWVDRIAHREDVFVHDFSVFSGFLAVEERGAAGRRVRLHRWRGNDGDLVLPDDPLCHATLADNEEIDSGTLRYSCTSLTTPIGIYDYDFTTGRRTLLKQEAVVGDFDPDRYTSELLWAPARDGERIPVPVVYRRGYARDGTAPLLQHGYGAYGLPSEPEFSSSLLSLLDRGFVFAIAQVRGGQELGRRWYDAGRLLAKRNSFDDFVDVTRFLVAEGYADPERVFARGGSAGGLLVAAVANMAPERYRAVVAHVPFVDVVTTMLDESIPLTTGEYDEWGDPADRAQYEYMLSYSPYDNVRAQDYPAMLVTTGLWDSQVQYYEPAKWVARLRRLRTDQRPLLFRIQMEAGHGGPSGRFRRYRELAEEYAFLLDQAGIGR